MAKRTESGEYISAHVSQADKVYQQLLQSGVGVEGWRQNGEVVTFRTAQPAPTHRRRSRWWLWIVGAVVAFFVVAAMLKGGMLAASTGAALAGVLLFGSLGFVVHRMTINGGFLTLTIGSLVVGVLLIGAMTGVESTYNPEMQARTQAIADECGGLGNGDVQCRWDSFVDSGRKLVDVAQGPESEGLGTALLIFLVLFFGVGWLYWKRYVIGAK